MSCLERCPQFRSVLRERGPIVAYTYNTWILQFQFLGMGYEVWENETESWLLFLTKASPVLREHHPLPVVPQTTPTN